MQQRTGRAAGYGFDTDCLWNTRKTERRRFWNPLTESDGRILDVERDAYGPDIFTELFIAVSASQSGPTLLRLRPNSSDACTVRAETPLPAP